MTPRERDVLDVVRSTLERSGVAPTLDEIALQLGWASKSNAHAAVAALVKAGHLRRIPSFVRGLALADTPSLVGVSTAALQAELRRRAERSA